jgi:hypothetical protein
MGCKHNEVSSCDQPCKDGVYFCFKNFGCMCHQSVPSYSCAMWCVPLFIYEGLFTFQVISAGFISLVPDLEGGGGGSVGIAKRGWHEVMREKIECQIQLKYSFVAFNHLFHKHWLKLLIQIDFNICWHCSLPHKGCHAAFWFWDFTHIFDMELIYELHGNEQ